MSLKRRWAGRLDILPRLNKTRDAANEGAPALTRRRVFSLPTLLLLTILAAFAFAHRHRRISNLERNVVFCRTNSSSRSQENEMTTVATMPRSANGGGSALANAQHAQRLQSSKDEVAQNLADAVQKERNVGDLIGMDYDTADVLIHDSMKVSVGGVPHSCLLIATRMKPDVKPQLDDADAQFILLRVLGASKLPSDMEMQQKRLDAAKRAADSPSNYDENNITDTLTLYQMRYAGAHCRILGSFRPRLNPQTELYELAFSADIDNFYAGQGMKIYKPAGIGLQIIVNHAKGENVAERRIEIGRLRYSASAYSEDAPEAVPIEMTTADIIAKRTALFGMTRTGKSNTVKTIADAVFRMRLDEGNPVRVAQLIIDPEGEYANQNAQDQGALRNLNNIDPQVDGDAVIHSFIERKDDPYRRIMKINFYGGAIPLYGSDKSDYDKALASLYAGKDKINERLQTEDAAYVQAFRSTDIAAPTDVNISRIRYNRAIFLYRAILHRAGFHAPQNIAASAKGLFGNEIRTAMKQNDRMRQFVTKLEGDARLTWDEAADFCQALAEWKANRNSNYADFNENYRKDKKHKGRDWHDDRINGLLSIFENPRGRGIQAIRECRHWHGAAQNQEDPIERIVRDLEESRLVILDQALGNPAMNEQSAKQIMWRLFERQQRHFVNPDVNADGSLRKPPPVIVYVEEAHTLLPKGSETDTSEIWPRIAKEGAKFNIGLVYSTQEPSSVQTNILTNTENWFISYLNSKGETRELDKYYDFEDFTPSIRKTNEPGFARVRTHSSPYTIPGADTSLQLNAA